MRDFKSVFFPKNSEHSRIDHGGIPEQDKEVDIGIKEGDTITWKNDTARIQFSRPAFGYGDGPFKLLRIIRQNLILYEINTPKGKKAISATYFKKETGVVDM